MQFMDEKHYDVLYDEDVFVRKPDGSPLLVLLKKAIPTHVNAYAWSALKKYSPNTDNRSIASGIEAEPRKKMDGTYSKTTRVPKGWGVGSGIVGFYERTVRMPYCHPCSWNDKNPERLHKLLPMVDCVNNLFKEHLPDKWQSQLGYCEKISKEWLIGNSVFTTLTVNKNFRTAAHKDAGDLPQGFSCMSVIRDGKYHGGQLVLPNYRLAVELNTGDLIMFDPHEYHGNTQIIPISPGATRCSVVYYFREQMQFCKSQVEELNFAKNRKPGDAIWPSEEKT